MSGQAYKIRFGGSSMEVSLEQAIVMLQAIMAEIAVDEESLLRREVRLGSVLLQLSSGLGRSAYAIMIKRLGLHTKKARRRVLLAAKFASADGQLDSASLAAAVDAWNVTWPEDRIERLTVNRAERLASIRTGNENTRTMLVRLEEENHRRPTSSAEDAVGRMGEGSGESEYESAVVLSAYPGPGNEDEDAAHMGVHQALGCDCPGCETDTHEWKWLTEADVLAEEFEDHPAAAMGIEAFFVCQACEAWAEARYTVGTLKAARDVEDENDRQIAEHDAMLGLYGIVGIDGEVDGSDGADRSDLTYFEDASGGVGRREVLSPQSLVLGPRSRDQHQLSLVPLFEAADRVRASVKRSQDAQGKRWCMVEEAEFDAMMALIGGGT